MERGDYPTELEAIRTIATRLGIGSAETVRKWVRRDQTHRGQRPEPTSDELAEIKTELIRPYEPWREVDHIEIETLY